MGEVRGAAANNKGASRRGPLSAYLFIIYDGEMMEDYDNDLKQETKDNAKIP